MRRYGACSPAAASPSSAPRPGKSHPTPTATPSSTASSTSRSTSPSRVFAFDEFGPLGIRPTAGSGWALVGHPERHPATYHGTHGVRYFHGCYSVGDDTLWSVNRRKKGTGNTLAALRSIRSARPDGAPIYVIVDNLSAHTGEAIRRWAKRNQVEL